jgi:hypothetical protein
MAFRVIAAAAIILSGNLPGVPSMKDPFRLAAVLLLFLSASVARAQTAAEMEGQSGGSIGIVDHRYLGKRGIFDGSNNLLKPAGHIVAIGNFAALIANLGRHVLNDDDTISNIGGKSRKTVLRFAFAHKAGHGISSLRVLKSADHSAGFGTYAVMSHNSVPLEPQTICRHLLSGVRPETRQLGKG